MKGNSFGFLFLAFIVVIAFLIVLSHEYFRGYKQGQIDALSGKVKYKLVVYPDSTRTWEEKGER